MCGEAAAYTPLRQVCQKRPVLLYRSIEEYTPIVVHPRSILATVYETVSLYVQWSLSMRQWSILATVYETVETTVHTQRLRYRKFSVDTPI